MALFELQKSSQPDDAYEIRTDDGSIKRRKADEVSVGYILLDYPLPYHNYGDNNLRQRESEGNFFTLMAHVFTLLLLVDHDFYTN